MVEDMTNDEKAIQVQEVADCISKAVAHYSTGAVFFGVALYFASYLATQMEKEHREDQLRVFADIVRSFLDAPSVDGHSVN